MKKDLCLQLRRLLPLFAWAIIGLAAAPPARAFDPNNECQTFIAPAEQYYRLPTGLLKAIATVESGRFGVPYPWALNIAGRSWMAPDYASAAAKLRDSAGGVRRDVAIGCLQIHMAYHLQPFRTPEWALQPRYNVWYGALFLRQLGDHYGNWRDAVGHYHASDPQAQRTYLCLVSRELRSIAPQTAGALGLPFCRRQDEIRIEIFVAPLMAARRHAPLQLHQDADGPAPR